MRASKTISFSLVLLICVSCTSIDYSPTGGISATLNEDLVRAVKIGNIDKVRTLLETGADANAKVGSGFTALDLSGDTVLMIASQEGNPGIAGLLIEKGADVNALNRDGITALMYAAQGGHSEVIKLLLEAGAERDAQNNNGTTALLVASIEGHTEVVRSLIEAGADVNVADKEGLSALSAAAQTGHSEIALIVREAGAREYGLVAYYPFSGNANDESGNGNHGRVVGAKLTSDRFGNTNSACDFDGKNSYIATPVDIDISKMPELTMSVWVYPRQTQYEGVVDHERRQILSSDDRDFDRSLVLQNGYWEVYMGGRYWMLREVPVFLNTWQHLAIVFGTSSVEFYKNGIGYSSGFYSGTGSTMSRLTIGDNASHKWHQPFDGIIDEVRIYNRRLSESEIQDLYNATKDVPATLGSAHKTDEAEHQAVANRVETLPEKTANQQPSTPPDDQLTVDKSDLSDAMIITVLDFAIENIPQNEGKVIVDMIGSEIFHTRKFRVIDREQRETILEEIEFSYADCTDIGCQLELGKLLAANYIVVGSLAQIASRYLISTKLIDIESGETISTSHDIYQSLDDLIDGISAVVETLCGF